MVQISPTSNLKTDLEDHRGTSPVVIGYAMLLASLFAYALCEYIDIRDNSFTIFWLHYIISVAYTSVLIHADAFGIRLSWKKENIHSTVIAANIYLISAYALNRDIHVFSTSVEWLCYYIVITSGTLLSFRYANKLPPLVRKMQYLLLGSATVFYLYLVVYVAPFYIFGTVGLLMLGIGIHVFLPLALLAVSVSLFIHNPRKPVVYYWAGSGVIATVAFVIAFSLIWNSRIEKIETLANQSVMNREAELPIWVTVAQELTNDWISSRILKSDLVYTTGDRFPDSDGFRFRGVSWGEDKKHDPLVFISTLSKKCSLSNDDRIKILKAISNGRHYSNERLWSGENLTTSYIVSDIDIYPALRLAYTEKYINVRNNHINNNRWWGSTEEAIYTFYLPEGSVVTSLSLWIEGKEQKAILTSKQKAQKAYSTIVGVERRDPSVVHWQEGNTVTVRVFPCTPGEERKFKLGITSPLQQEQGVTVYKNIVFDGPDGEQAKETKRIRFIGSAKDIDLPSDFAKDKKGDYRAEQNYDPDFKVTFKTEPIPDNGFTFDGYRYSLSEYSQEYLPAKLNRIYLDINNSWTQAEIDVLKEFLVRYDLYVHADEAFIKLDTDNWASVTRDVRNRNFTVFPFHHVKNASNALVVTKGSILSPHLSDFRDSKFADSTGKFFSLGEKINVFNLQGGSSTYIKSLKELRALEFATGSAQELKSILHAKSLPYSSESDKRIILHDAKMVISKTKTENISKNNAPDHLARLFAYNDIMRKAGPHYLNNDYVNEDLVHEAGVAYVVSPVSSLIVLETQDDYKRFGIEETANSLQNAVRQSSGAVPEPHEWALIILFALLAIYLRFKRSPTKSSVC